MSDYAQDVDRRQFLTYSAAVVGLGATGKWAELRDLVKRSRETQRPALSEANVAAYLTSVRSNAMARQAFLAAVQADVRAFLRNNFTLTAAQDRNLTAFSSTEVSTIVNAVGRGFTGKNELRVRMALATSSDGVGRCRVSSARTLKLVDGVNAEVWTVTSQQDCSYGTGQGC